MRGFVPVALPRVAHIRVVDDVFVRLLVQEVKHVFNGQRKGTASVYRAEERLKEVVHKLLKSTLQTERGKRGVRESPGKNNLVC